MGIKFDNKKAFDDFLNGAETSFEKNVLNHLIKLGNEFIKARLNTLNTFNNQTTRLRNSIGYVVSNNGKVEHSDFESYGISGSADAEGIELGRNYATEIASQIEGFALVCVAGADYAFYVEAKGYNVITGSVLKLKQELNKWSM